MGLQRRRHPERWVIPAVPPTYVLSTAALLLLVVFAFLSLLAPPLPDHPSFPHPLFCHRCSHLPSLLNPVELQRNVVAADPFRVPSGGGSPVSDLWGSKQAKYFYGCSNASSEFAKEEAITQPNRYLMIATSGGLNQQRTGDCQVSMFSLTLFLVKHAGSDPQITDAVVAARILNATLVVPKLDQKSFWKDASDFAEIFDVDWFISSLSKDVKIIKQLPKKGGKVIGTPYTMRVPRKCAPTCYETRVLPVLLKKHIVQLTKFDYRLSNKLETNLQKLRCRVNYHALRFTDPIQEMGDRLIRRMKARSKHFIALHLRFEPDMLAFSGCYYGGGEKERRELGAIRKRWKTLHTSNSDKERRHGKCPLTPEEVGLLLRALGFGKDVHIYVASGEVYGGEETLAPLKAVFPNFHSKETLASKVELAPFAAFSSRMAALDFIVCDGSDVFVTNNNGNMARMLAGRRRYFGHRRTIRPNAKKLYSVFLNRTCMAWEAFASKVRTCQKGFMGEPNEVRPGRGEFHENPSTCICENSKKESATTYHIQSKIGIENEKSNSTRSIGEPTDNPSSDEESDWRDFDYGENTPLGGSLNGTDQEYDLFIRSEVPDLQEMLSD